MNDGQAPLPPGPNGEIPLRRDEDGEIVYMTREELWERSTRHPPDVATAAIGKLQEAIERLRIAASRPQPTAEPEAGPQMDSMKGRDPERLLTAQEVSEILSIPKDSVYELGGLSRVQLGERRVRWRFGDVQAFIEKRSQEF